MVRGRMFLVAAALTGAVVLAGCSAGSDGVSTSTTLATTTTEATTTSTATSVPTTTAPTTTTATTAPSTGTTTASGPSSTAAPGFTPGQTCTAGSNPDCIDPEGDGTFSYLIGGAQCMASPLSESACADLDGDGYAGYPDRG